MTLLRSFKRFVGRKGAHFLENSKLLSALLKKFSCYIVRNDPQKANYSYLLELVKLLGDRKITTVFDVGACNGRYGAELRKFGYQGKLISFEPVHRSFQELVQLAKGDALWTCHRLGLGDEKSTKKIRVLKELPASSFLEVSSRHREVNPQAHATHEEEVEIRTLDAFYSAECSLDDRVFLKIDTQGYEKKVLEGARNCLHNIDLVQLEVSLEALYEQELLLPDFLSYMKERQFVPIALSPLSLDPKTGEFLQMDILFSNKERR